MAGHPIKGKKYPKMSKSRKGKFYPNESHFQKGQTPWNKGRKGLQTSKWKGKKVPHLRGYQFKKGKEHCNWKGGITPQNLKIRHSIETELWREAVFARDNWTCQKYGTKGGKLHAHHIKNFAQYPKLRFAIDNGITFSGRAHREFHRKYGYKNTNKKQLKEFLCQKDGDREDRKIDKENQGKDLL